MGWGGPHFGLMHLVATHIVGWIRHVLQVFEKGSSSGLEGGSDCDDLNDQESLHELHEAGKQADSEVKMDESRPHGESAAHKVQP